MNSFRFLERGIEAEIARQEGIVARRRRGRAGDAPLRPAVGQPHLAALEGGGARLPLLPRAGPRAARAHRGDAGARPRRAAGAAGGARRAARARPRAAGRDRARCWPSAAELGDFYEAAVSASAGETPRRSPTGSPTSWLQRLGDADPAGIEARARGLRAAGGDGGRQDDLGESAGKRGARRAARRGRRPRRRSWRSRAWPCGGDELDAIVDRAIAANPDAVEKIRAGKPEGDRRARRRVMRETKGRADGGEVQRLIRGADRRVTFRRHGTTDTSWTAPATPRSPSGHRPTRPPVDAAIEAFRRRARRGLHRGRERGCGQRDPGA